MVNMDFGYRITVIEKRLDTIMKQVSHISMNPDLTNQDWDRATLMREWGISPRSVANYQKQGLRYYKRGGRIFFRPEDRKAFILRKKVYDFTK